MTHDLFRLESEVRELSRWYAEDRKHAVHNADRIAWLEDRVAQLLAGAGEPCTRSPTRPVYVAPTCSHGQSKPCKVCDWTPADHAADAAKWRALCCELATCLRFALTRASWKTEEPEWEARIRTALEEAP